MKIVSVKINDILSIAQAEVTFDDSGLMLVQGWNHDIARGNGAGKTTLFNAIAFALYDKLPRKITATEILRRGCRSGCVEVICEVDQHRYMVQRSRPKGVRYFEILDEPRQMNITQDEWESKLRLSYSQFIVAMYCAQGTSPRFLSINDGDKKQFLLQLLNLDEFASCRTLADGKVRQLEDASQRQLEQIRTMQAKVDAYRESQVDVAVVQATIQSHQRQLVELNRKLAEVQAVAKPDVSRYQQLEDEVNRKRSELARARERREVLHDQYRKISAKVRLFDGASTCRACGANLDTTQARQQHAQEQAQYQDELSSLKRSIDRCDQELLKEPKIDALVSQVREKKRAQMSDYERASTLTIELRSDITSQQRIINELNDRLHHSAELQAKISQLLDQQQSLSEEIDRGKREIELLKSVAAIYAPTGAPAYILDSVIAMFNERVLEYVNVLWSNVTYELTSYKETVKGDVVSKFSEHLTMDGKSISIGSLSGGEFRALSLCVDFALIGVLEGQFGLHLSPIILDEPFDGLDNSGRELIMGLLEQLATSRQVTIIDHASEVKSMFSKIINVEKRGGVSTVSVLT